MTPHVRVPPRQVAGELPASWHQFKALARRWFPGGVYDTKVGQRGGMGKGAAR